MSLIETIRNYSVPRGSVATWWLGQNGFIFKTPEGTLLSIDLYLSDSAKRLYPDCPVNLKRQVPIFIQPPDLVADVYAWEARIAATFLSDDVFVLQCYAAGAREVYVSHGVAGGEA